MADSSITPTDQLLLSQLYVLAGAVDRPFALELLRAFAESTRESFEALGAARAARDLKAFGAAAHRLKSSFATLGMEAEARGCTAIEDAARRGSWDESLRLAGDISGRYAEMVPAVDRLVAYLEARV